MVATTRVQELYSQQVVNLTPQERLQLLVLLAGAVQHDATLAIEPPKRDIMELEGLGKGLWQGEDAQEYVNKLRGGWEGQ